MPIDSSLITRALAGWQIPQVAIPDPAAQAARLQALQHGMQQQTIDQQQIATGALEYHQKRQAVEEQQVLNDAFKAAYAPDPVTGQVKLNQDALFQNLSARGLGARIPGIQKTISDANEAAVKFSKTKTDANVAKQDYLAQQLLYTKDNGYDPTTFTSTLAAALDHGALEPAEAAKINQQFQQNPTAAGVQALIDPLLAASPQVQETLSKRATAAIAKAKADAELPGIAADTAQKVAGGDATTLAAAWAKGGPDAFRAALDEMPHARALRFEGVKSPEDIRLRAMTPRDAAQTVQATETAAETKRYHDKELENAAAQLGISRARLYQDKEETQLTPAAVAKMSEMFATTGQLPPMGMGRAGAKVRSQIINAAAENYPTVQFATQKAAYQANQASLKQAQRTFDQVTAAENTARANLEVFLNTAKKVVDAGSPWINKPLRSVTGQGLGSGDMAAFNAARQTAINEIAKVLNNPGGSASVSDSARHEIEGLIGPDATLAQIYSAANILKTDMSNRHQMYKQQIDAINQRISGGGEAQGAPAAGGTGGGGGDATHRFDPQTGRIYEIKK